MNIADIRKDFPIFSQQENKDLVYLDNAATSQRPKTVLDAVTKFSEHFNSNIHRSAYKMAERATAGYECARLQAAQFIGASDANNIVFTSGATESINFIAYGWARKHLNPGDQIIVTEMEHHANLIPWQMAAKATATELVFVEFDENGELNYDQFAQLLNEKTRIVAITHASNVLGTEIDLSKIVPLAHDAGAIVAVDGCQHVPHAAVDVSELDVDFYSFSGHKMLGPMGIGILYGKPERLQEMEPVLFGGSMIDDVQHHYSTWTQVPWKFEAGTQNIPAVIGLGAAIEYLEKLGFENIKRHSNELTQYALQEMQNIDGVRIYGPQPDRIPLISFGIEGIHPHDAATFFDSKNVAIRSGHHCAKLLMKRLGVNALARVSFYIYNTKREVDIFLDTIDKAKGFFT